MINAIEGFVEELAKLRFYNRLGIYSNVKFMIEFDNLYTCFVWTQIGCNHTKLAKISLIYVEQPEIHNDCVCEVCNSRWYNVRKYYDTMGKISTS